MSLTLISGETNWLFTPRSLILLAIKCAYWPPKLNTKTIKLALTKHPIFAPLERSKNPFQIFLRLSFQKLVCIFGQYWQLPQLAFGVLYRALYIPVSQTKASLFLYHSFRLLGLF